MRGKGNDQYLPFDMDRSVSGRVNKTVGQNSDNVVHIQLHFICIILHCHE